MANNIGQAVVIPSGLLDDIDGAITDIRRATNKPQMLRLATELAGLIDQLIDVQRQANEIGST